MKKSKPMRRQESRIETVTQMVDNPYYSRAHPASSTNPIKIQAEVNFRESAIALLARRGLLDAAQVAAADRFRALWERMGGAGAKAIDYTRERVDGGGRPDPIDMTQLEAGRELKRCRELLGVYGYNIVRLVAGERRSLHEICGSRRDREFTSMSLKRDLTALAQMWNFQTKTVTDKKRGC